MGLPATILRTKRKKQRKTTNTPAVVILCAARFLADETYNTKRRTLSRPVEDRRRGNPLGFGQDCPADTILLELSKHWLKIPLMEGQVWFSAFRFTVLLITCLLPSEAGLMFALNQWAHLLLS